MPRTVLSQHEMLQRIRNRRELVMFATQNIRSSLNGVDFASDSQYLIQANITYQELRWQTVILEARLTQR